MEAEAEGHRPFIAVSDASDRFQRRAVEMVRHVEAEGEGEMLARFGIVLKAERRGARRLLDQREGAAACEAVLAIG